MPINHNEIIEEIEGQIRKSGGAWNEWNVGTAKDSRGPFFQRHREADLGDGLAYREAYTTTASARLEARWFATPFLQGSFILDCMPVYPGALPDTFSSV